MPDSRRAVGAAGEERAAAWYRARGYRIVARNWRCREGEIDLVATRRGVVVVVEVKTRRSDRFGTPAEAVTPAKQRRLRTLAVRYLEETGQRPRSLRFDVVAILGGRLEVIEAAFLSAPPVSRGRPRRRGARRRAARRSPSPRRQPGCGAAGGTG